MGRRIRLSGTTGFHDLVAKELRPYTAKRCIDMLQRFLLRRLEHASLHSTVGVALREIEHDYGCLRVPDLAGRCHVSLRHLHCVMRVWVGYGPKCYAKIVRFQSTLREMSDMPDGTVATLASENGFLDQAHLTLDVARLAGATPRHLASVGVSDFSKTGCDDRP